MTAALSPEAPLERRVRHQGKLERAYENSNEAALLL